MESVYNTFSKLVLSSNLLRCIKMLIGPLWARMFYGKEVKSCKDWEIRTYRSSNYENVYKGHEQKNLGI
jgi:hypothetical protein